MNDQEWTDVKKRIFLTFPAVAAWASGLDPEPVRQPDGSLREVTEGREAMARRWKLALSKESHEHALRAIDMIAAMPEPPWKYVSEYELVAARIAEVCRTFRPSTSSPESLPKIPRGRYVAEGTFQRVTSAIARDARHSAECREHRVMTGRCHRDCPVPQFVADEINREPCNLPADNQRFDCWSCRDTGHVSCLKWSTIRDVVRTSRQTLLCSGATFSAYCTCAKGHAIVRTEHGVEFDATTMVVSVQPFRDLLSACRAALDNATNLTHKRTSAFDDFNNQEPASAEF